MARALSFPIPPSSKKAYIYPIYLLVHRYLITKLDMTAMDTAVANIIISIFNSIGVDFNTPEVLLTQLRPDSRGNYSTVRVTLACAVGTECEMILSLSPSNKLGGTVIVEDAYLDQLNKEGTNNFAYIIHTIAGLLKVSTGYIMVSNDKSAYKDMERHNRTNQMAVTNTTLH